MEIMKAACFGVGDFEIDDGKILGKSADAGSCPSILRKPCGYLISVFKGMDRNAIMRYCGFPAGLSDRFWAAYLEASDAGAIWMDIDIDR